MKLIVPIGESLTDLMVILREDNKLYVDPMELVNICVDCLSHLQEASGNINQIEWLLGQDLMEPVGDETISYDDEVTSIIHHAQGLCLDMMDKFKDYKMYKGNELAYVFDGVLDDSTIVLKSI